MTDPVPSKDLVSRLRVEHSHGLSDDAADEIERLRAALRGIQSCSTCEACRGTATRALAGVCVTPPPPDALIDVRSVDCPACGKPMSEHKGDLRPGAVLWCP